MKEKYMTASEFLDLLFKSQNEPEYVKLSITSVSDGKSLNLNIRSLEEYSQLVKGDEKTYVLSAILADKKHPSLICKRL